MEPVHFIAVFQWLIKRRTTLDKLCVISFSGSKKVFHQIFCFATDFVLFCRFYFAFCFSFTLIGLILMGHFCSLPDRKILA